MSVSSGLVSMISSHGSHFLASLHAWLFLAVCWAFLYLQIFWSFALRCSRYLETVWFFLVFVFKICRWDPVCVQSSAECFPLWVLSSVPSGLSRGWFPSLGWFPHIPVLSSTQPNTFTSLRSSLLSGTLSCESLPPFFPWTFSSILSIQGFHRVPPELPALSCGLETLSRQ